MAFTYLVECQTTRPLDNSPQSSDSVVDKRTKNNLCDVKSWVHILGGLFGSVMNERMRGLVVWAELSMK